MSVISDRVLNRTTLARQLLLHRSDLEVPAAVEHLVGLQAQAPFPPYTGLWTRLAGFVPDDLARLLLDRGVVRIALMRGTVHLVTAADCLALRPVMQRVLDGAVRSGHGARLAGLDLTAVVAAGRRLVEPDPSNSTELARRLVERWPGYDRQLLANVVRAGLPLVQVPPRAVWGHSGAPTVTTAEHWLGRPLATDTAPDAVVLRYLRAFGPARVADVQKWSGLTGLREVVERLRPALRTLRDERGADLYDLVELPLADADTDAPVRFLPEFDNLLLAYVDASRVLAAEHRSAVFTVNGIIRPTVLVDGRVAAVWRVTRTRGVAVLDISALTRLPARIRTRIEAEGGRLLAFTAADAERREIRFG